LENKENRVCNSLFAPATSIHADLKLGVDGEDLSHQDLLRGHLAIREPGLRDICTGCDLKPGGGQSYVIKQLLHG
jgi:hypothetical protein